MSSGLLSLHGTTGWSALRIRRRLFGILEWSMLSPQLSMCFMRILVQSRILIFQLIILMFLLHVLSTALSTAGTFDTRGGQQ